MTWNTGAYDMMIKLKPIINIIVLIAGNLLLVGLILMNRNRK